MFQECTLFEAAIQSKSNAMKYVVHCSKYKIKWMLENKSNYNNMNSNSLKIYLFTQQPSIEDTVAITHSSRN